MEACPAVTTPPVGRATGAADALAGAMTTVSATSALDANSLA